MTDRKSVPPLVTPKDFTIRVIKNGEAIVLELDGKHADKVSKIWPVAYLGMIAEVRIRDLHT